MIVRAIIFAFAVALAVPCSSWSTGHNTDWSFVFSICVGWIIHAFQLWLSDKAGAIK